MQRTTQAYYMGMVTGLGLAGLIYLGVNYFSDNRPVVTVQNAETSQYDICLMDKQGDQNGEVDECEFWIIAAHDKADFLQKHCDSKEIIHSKETLAELCK